MRKCYLLILFLFCLGIVTAPAQYKVLLNFNDTNGANPYGSLILSGTTLYGMTSVGGANGIGCVFSLNTTGNVYTDLLDFNRTNGADPYGSLILSGTTLYGMTSVGGANGIGCVFSLNTTGNVYTDLLDFNNTNGAGPCGSLILSGTTLYGMTSVGGANSVGCVFSLNTTGNVYTDLLDFNRTNGANPYGSLILSGTTLYGMTSVGGANGAGCVFSLNTTGNVYTDLLDFNRTNGANPYGSLILSGTTLYGMTSVGGANIAGCVFSLNTTGNVYTDLLDFNNTNGANPYGSLILSGTTLYGMTSVGGANIAGCVFSLNTTGNVYTDLLDFNNTNGANPYGSLILSGTTLYGMTNVGGAWFDGVIFSFKLCDFDVTTNITANVICNGGNDGSATVTPSGGISPYSYLWATVGGTNSTASGLSAGTYTVTVTDINNNCAYSHVVTITQPPVLNATTNVITNVSCNGGNNGSASANPSGGTSPYTYSWSPGSQANSSASGLTTGTYTIMVTDANGCSTTSTGSITITQPTAVLTEGMPTLNQNVLCFSESNGSATAAMPAGGTSPYSYSWSSNGGTNLTASNLSAGTYTVIITDNNGCTATSSGTVIITQPASALTDGAPTVNQNVLCFGESNGNATAATPIGGISPYIYSWSPDGGTNLTASNLSAGTYTITIIDNNGCTTTSTTVTITQPAPLNASGNVIANVSCYGGNNGSDSVSLSGGATPYTYSWSGGSGTNATVKELSAGTYKVYITDANGCDTTTAITITQPTPLTVTPSSGVICNGDNTGTAMVMPAGGVSPYTYSWLPTGGANNTGTSLSAGIYTVTCTDNNGCVETGTVTIQQPLPPVINICCDSTIAPGQDVQLISSGGTSYLWSPLTGLSCDSCSNPVASPSQTTTYTVTVNDSGCISTRTITIDVGCGDVFVPTAFSPNEGHNNMLYVRGTCIANMEFLVFDRWGNKVFESENLNFGWDGTYGGLPMNMATYVWYLKATLCDGTSVEKKGNVTLVR